MWLDTKEYGEVCHAVRNKGASKIPKKDYLLYGRYFYMYTHDEDSHKIEFTRRVPIEGNERIIKGFIEEVENANKE